MAAGAGSADANVRQSRSSDVHCALISGDHGDLIHVDPGAISLNGLAALSRNRQLSLVSHAANLVPLHGNRVFGACHAHSERHQGR